MNCIGCHASETRLVPVGYPLLRHYDFEVIRPDGALWVCPTCGMVMTGLDGANRRTIADLFGSEAYAHSPQTGQSFLLAGRPHPVTRTSLQAELILAQMPGPPRRILDIGCFDGALLKELSLRLGGETQMHGYDVNPHLADRFPRGPAFHFRHDGLAELPGPFDLICLSHSLIYFEDLTMLAGRIDALLAPGGQVFVQTPDILANPCFLLMGDQLTHLTEATLRGCLARMGLAARFFSVPWARRDCVCLAHRERVAAPRTIPDLEGLLAQLDRTAAVLRALRPPGRIYILGTTAAAAFAHGVLDGRVTGFADENPHSVGRHFRALRVIHPGHLTPEDSLVIPYGPSAPAIVARFQTCYHGQFYAV